jgi:CheY-like chemotaxis protein
MTSAIVIDDNRLTADTLCKMLEILGVDSRAAYGPRAAILEIRKHPVDLIFLDINMPGVDGFEVLGYLRREPDLRHIPVVMVTSDDQPETATRAQETGALHLMLKPVTVEALEKILAKTKLNS